MAVILSLPTYVPDPTSAEVVVGYELQSCAPTVGLPLFTGIWTTVTGSPFLSNRNIVDPTGVDATLYRARPTLQVPVSGSPVTLDTPWSAPFTRHDLAYDFFFTRVLLPTLRFTYMNDAGIAQTNGTVLAETSGAGNGLWRPNGTQTRFALQYIANDDPIRVLDGSFRMIRKNASGAFVQCLPDIDYSVEAKNGMVEFSLPPASDDYLRFDFYRSDFVNVDLLQGLRSAVNALSQFGINGYQVKRENNLAYCNSNPNLDLVEIICKLAIYLMRQGATESALRSSMSWRDGAISEDPYPSRALQFLVQDLDLTEKSLQKRANSYIRSQTGILVRGDFDLELDITQMTPFNTNMFMPFNGIDSTTNPFYSWWM